jgi:hypothetical protein
VLVHQARDPIWVISAGQQLCIAQVRGAACAPKYRARHEGVFLGTFRPPTKRDPALHDFLVQGLVPNGVRQVALVIGTHRTVVIDVKENVFSFERDEPVHVKRLLWD